MTFVDSRLRSRLLKLGFAVFAVGTLAGCTGNGASKEVLIDTLQTRAQMSTDQAQCVADEIYTGRVEGEVDGVEQSIQFSEDDINSQSSKSDGDRDPNYDKLVEESLNACGVG